MYCTRDKKIKPTKKPLFLTPFLQIDIKQFHKYWPLVHTQNNCHPTRAILHFIKSPSNNMHVNVMGGGMVKKILIFPWRHLWTALSSSKFKSVTLPWNGVLVWSKLMRLGFANQIIVVESNSDSKFNGRLTSIWILTINIESTIVIFDINQYKIDLFLIK